MKYFASGAGAMRFGSYELRKLGKGLGIALLGALATYLQDQVPSVDFGEWTLVAGAVNAAVINAIRLWISDNT